MSRHTRVNTYASGRARSGAPTNRGWVARASRLPDVPPSLASRSIGALLQRDHIQTDVKYTTYAQMMGVGFPPLSATVQSGPSYDTQPVFVFSESTYKDVLHQGMPDRWQFPWVRIQWPAPPTGPTPL